MNKSLILALIISLFLVGCTKKEPAIEKPPIIPIDDNEPVEHKEETPQNDPILHVNPSTFHFVATFLANDRILYVEKEGNFYQLKSFHITTGESEVIYEDEAFITDVFVHPDSEHLLIHTSENNDSALVKIIKLDGTLEHEIEISSTELSIEWNAIDPKKVLFTAFHEDWSFDLFVFDGHSESLDLLLLDDPFPKWFGDGQIASADFEHPLDGGEITITDSKTLKSRKIGIKNAIFFDTFKDSMLVVEAPQDGISSYSLIDSKGEKKVLMNMPAISNYSEWLVPEVEWIHEKEFFLLAPQEGGQLDQLTSPFQLMHVSDGNAIPIAKDLEWNPMNCSSDGKLCMVGYTKEEMVHMETGERRNWIQIEE
ncbi:hypothetical protein [Sporosarcina sp. USHLN248]|uniref:YqgU-like beta propeller domain-containing protein n=1 Tax=Sporosarcina sp. USHLN248 TaxID=3081300 RepID=UPI003019EAC9